MEIEMKDLAEFKEAIFLKKNCQKFIFKNREKNQKQKNFHWKPWKTLNRRLN